MKICFKKKQNKTLNKAKLRKQKQNDQNKKKGNNFPPAGVEPRPLTWQVDALSIVPRQQVLSIDVKLIIFNVFAHEILPADVL